MGKHSSSSTHIPAVGCWSAVLADTEKVVFGDQGFDVGHRYDGFWPAASFCPAPRLVTTLLDDVSSTSITLDKHCWRSRLMIHCGKKSTVVMKTLICFMFPSFPDVTRMFSSCRTDRIQ
ncbi:hypothetical protein BaRGS_00038549 [Batillaria attramentaria]|uniref:Uncharacterized protein n=1 Tax=Batillaria attramentaria TaxID=370345 RepID=A0ABD0J5H8_9CAEN